MTTKLLIDRELLEQAISTSIDEVPERIKARAEITRILAAPRQPEGEGLEVRAIEQHHRTDGRIEEHELCRLSDAQRAIAELREEISDLHTTMMAAAVEIQDHWQAHCDEEGYGPANLIHRLERGIAAQYGYTAQTLVQIEAERDTLRQQLAELRAQLLAIASAEPRRHTIEWAKAMAATGNNEAYAKWREAFDQRDRLAGLLAKAQEELDPHRHAVLWGEICTALAEVK